MPAWNAGAFIEATLAALSAQTYANLEVLVSVDLSTDDTEGLCRTHARRDPRLRVIAQRSRQGFVGNTAALLREADGDYGFWAWHDDLVLPDYVSRLVPAMQRSSRVAVAFTDLELHTLDGRIEARTYTALDGLADPVGRARRVLRMPENWWLPNRGLFRVSDARQIGGFKRHARGDYKCDWPWAVHMALLGEHVRVPGIGCRKFLRDTSLSVLWQRDWRTHAAVTLACAREIARADLRLIDRARLLGALPGVVVDFAARRAGAGRTARHTSAYRPPAHARPVSPVRRNTP